MIVTIMLKLRQGWAGEMILRGYSPEQRKNSCIRFIFGSIEEGSDPWIFEGVDIVPINWEEPRMRPVADSFGMKPMSQILFGDYARTLQPMPEMSLDGCRHLREYVPQWPWVVAQICMLGNTSELICTERLKFILAVVQNPSPVCPFRKWLNRFSAPMDLVGWRISRFPDWQ